MTPIEIIALSVFLLALPIAGYLAEKWGRSKGLEARSPKGTIDGKSLDLADSDDSEVARSDSAEAPQVEARVFDDQHVAEVLEFLDFDPSLALGQSHIPAEVPPNAIWSAMEKVFRDYVEVYYSGSGKTEEVLNRSMRLLREAVQRQQHLSTLEYQRREPTSIARYAFAVGEETQRTVVWVARVAIHDDQPVTVIAYDKGGRNLPLTEGQLSFENHP